MRTVFVTVAIFALTLMTTYSQTNDESSKMGRQEINTLVGTGDVHHSGYGGVHLKIGSINKKSGMFVGGRGGWLVNGKFTLGFAGYGLVSGRDITYYDKDDQRIDTKINLGYGGMYLEYIHEPVDVIHLTGSVLCGFGGALFDDIDWYHDHDYDYDNREKKPWAAYYVIEPTIGVELNVTKFMRIGVTASYRYMDDFESNQLYDDSQQLRESNMSGFNGGLYLVFGGF